LNCTARRHRERTEVKVVEVVVVINCGVLT
jgi:hypothetical protein